MTVGVFNLQADENIQIEGIDRSEVKYDGDFEFTKDAKEEIGSNVANQANAAGAGNETSMWVNYLRYYADFEFFDPRLTITRMFPDSTVKRVFTNQQGDDDHSYIHTSAIGTVFDPYEQEIGEVHLREDASYSIEGIRFPLRYWRGVDEFTTYDSTFADTIAYKFSVNGDKPDSLHYMTNPDNSKFYEYNDTEDRYDTIQLDSWQLIMYDYQNDDDPLRATDTIEAWPAYEVIEDDQDGSLDTNRFEHPNESIYQDYREVSVVVDIEEEVHDVEDHLLIQVFDLSSMEGGVLETDNEEEGMRVMAPPFNRDINKANDEDVAMSIEHPLTEDDHEDGGISGNIDDWNTFEIEFDDPLEVGAGEPMAVVITYQTNIPYSEGDTLYDSRGGEQEETRANMNYTMIPNLYDDAYLSDATGWDTESIEEQLRIFRSYNSNVRMPSIHRYEPLFDSPDHWLNDRYLPAQIFAYRYALLFPVDFQMSYNEEDLLYTSIGEEETASFEMNSAYPNPVSQGSSFNIEIGSEQAGDVEVEVYDLVGKKVAGIKENNLTPGSHNIEVSTEGWNKGVYLYSVKVNGEQQTRRIVVN